MLSSNYYSIITVSRCELFSREKKAGMWTTPVPSAVFLHWEVAISINVWTQVAKVSDLADAECSVSVSVANRSNVLQAPLRFPSC